MLLLQLLVRILTVRAGSRVKDALGVSRRKLFQGQQTRRKGSCWHVSGARRDNTVDNGTVWLAPLDGQVSPGGRAPGAWIEAGGRRLPSDVHV